MPETLIREDGTQLVIPNDVLAASDQRDLVVAYVHATSDSERAAIERQAAARLKPAAEEGERKLQVLREQVEEQPSAVLAGQVKAAADAD